MPAPTYPPQTLEQWMRWIERRISNEERRQYIAGVTGSEGPPGEGVPPGGTTGQVLTKGSGNDYDTMWADPTGGGAAAFRYYQSSAATTWTINHNLPFRPNVAVVDSTGTVIYPVIKYTSDTQVVLTFSAAVGGEAYLS